MSLAVKAARAQKAGDPGFFGDIGKFLGGAAKAVIGNIPIVSGIAGGISALTSGRPSGVPALTRPAPARPGGAFGMRPRQQPLAPAQAAQRAIGGAVGTGLACPAGYKANKSDYHLKDGTFIAAGSRCVRIRRRNPLNVRAADRAIGRIESAKKATERLKRVTVRKVCPHK